MAIEIRYFSTASAGDGLGLSWENRAELFSSGNWSSVITGFDFSSTNSLECRIGPGAYTCSQTFASGLFANAPTKPNPVILHGCDSSGVRVEPINQGWVSAQPMDDSNFPVIATTTSIVTLNLANGIFRCLKFTASARGGSILSSGNYDFISVENTAELAATVFVNAPTQFTNCQLKNAGTAFNYFGLFTAALATLNNVRMDGGSASSGNRKGIEHSTAGFEYRNFTILNCVIGVEAAGGAAGRSTVVSGFTIDNCDVAIKGNATTSQTVFHNSDRLYIANCGVGINAQEAFYIVTNSRLRDCTTAAFQNFDNYPTDLGNDTSAPGADAAARNAAEYVDYAGGDLRIKASSPFWAARYGAGNEIPTPAAIATAVWARVGRTLT